MIEQYADSLYRSLAASFGRLDHNDRVQMAIRYSLEEEGHGEGFMERRIKGHTPERSPATLSPNQCADATLTLLRKLSGRDFLRGVAGRNLLWERAALLNLPGARNQRNATNHCRLLQTRTGWLAVNLAREDDHGLLPAWLETPAAAQLGTPIDWSRLQSLVISQDQLTLHRRAQLLGLPIAALDSHTRTNWFAWQPLGAPLRETNAPRVVDLSALWAGPLCAHLLGALGAQVIKVESVHRPDGARTGSPEHYARLNQGKRHALLDFHNHKGLAKLAQLIEWADIVITASRPRALAQLGIEPNNVTHKPASLTTNGTLWLNITGYGGDPAHGHRVAFGDDAAIAGGLYHRARTPSSQEPYQQSSAQQGSAQQEASQTAGQLEWRPEFYADAVADPLTGLHAALATHYAWRAGKSGQLGVALADIAHLVSQWSDLNRRLQPEPGTAHAVREAVAAPGEHNSEIFSQLAAACY